MPRATFPRGHPDGAECPGPLAEESSSSSAASPDSFAGSASVAESALLLIGSCHEALRDYETARKTYYRYTDLFPARAGAGVMVTISETWIKEHKCSQAIPVLEETLRQWPKSDSIPLARMRLAECWRTAALRSGGGPA